MQMESAEPTLMLAILTGGYRMYYMHLVVIDCDCSHYHTGILGAWLLLPQCTSFVTSCLVIT